MTGRTFGKIELVQGLWWVITACEPHVIIRLKQLFPRIEKTAPPPYRFPDDLAHAADLDWFLTRYPLSMSDADRAHLSDGRLKFELQIAEMERILAPDYTPPAYAGLRPGFVVRNYQSQAIEVLKRSKGLLLGDDVGLGKTYTAYAHLLDSVALPAGIVCQGHVQRQWAEVCTKFTTLNAYTIPGTRPYSLPPADAYIWRYSQIAGWSDAYELLKLKTVIFDEPQELRTGTASSKGNGARRMVDGVEFILGLSATPIYNYGTEIWNVMQFIRPGLLGSHYEFLREWSDDWKTIKDPKALGAFLRDSHAFLRRTKKDVGQEVPPVNKVVEPIGHDEKAIRSIDDLAHHLAVRATSGSFIERGQATRELDMRVRQQTGVAKAPYVADFVRLLLESGEPVLLFGWHRDVYEIWNERLADFKPVMYTGSESTAHKERSKRAFIDGASDLMFMSLRAGAGVDGLQTRCSTVVIGELDWSPGVHHQNIGRLDREGQLNYPVNAFFLITEDGSDPPMVEVLGLKASQALGIVDPSKVDVELVHVGDPDHMRKLVERYLTKRTRKKLEEGGQQALALGAA